MRGQRSLGLGFRGMIERNELITENYIRELFHQHKTEKTNYFYYLGLLPTLCTIFQAPSCSLQSCCPEALTSSVGGLS